MAASRLAVLRTYWGTSAEGRITGWPCRLGILSTCTVTGPIPVGMSRDGRWPVRTTPAQARSSCCSAEEATTSFTSLFKVAARSSRALDRITSVCQPVRSLFFLFWFSTLLHRGAFSV